MVCSVTGELEQGVTDAKAGIRDGEAIGDEVVVAEGLLMAGYCLLGLGRMEEARTALDQAITRSAGGVNDFLHGLAMTVQGMLLFATGDLDGGMRLVSQARVIQERLEDCEGGGVALSFLAQMTFATGDYRRALDLYAEGLELLERVGDRPEIARVHCEMGWTALAGEDEAGAQQAFQRAVAAYEEVGSVRGTGLALLGLAAVEAAAGRAERAVTIAAAAQVMSEQAGVVVDHPMAPGLADRIERLKASIPKATLEELTTSGGALSPAAVLAMVRG